MLETVQTNAMDSGGSLDVKTGRKAIGTEIPGSLRGYLKQSQTNITTANATLPPNFFPDDESKELSFRCTETFNKTLEENLDVIKNYPRGDVEEYLLKLGVNKTRPDSMRTFPVFATAVDSYYYFGAQGLIKTIHEQLLANPRYEKKDVHIIVYDLGMTTIQYNKAKKKCKCEIRRFPFEKFPRHVMRLKLYAFKPILVQQLLMEFGFVWWLDSSIRFMTDNVDPAIDYAKKYSMLYSTTGSRDVCSITKMTDIGTFEYFQEDRCKFRPFGEIYATMILFHYDKITRIAVETWAACALNKNCIAPTGFIRQCDFMKNNEGRCHRFDQSVLGIITRRLFHEQSRYPLVYSLDEIYQIHKRKNVPYFE